jgi:ketosteroid isomerase-like protein
MERGVMERGMIVGYPNAVLLDRLFTALDRHDHATMAACYQPDATFRDIAFDLRGQRQIHSMWHMICLTDIRSQFQVVDADDRRGQVQVTDVYTFGGGRERPGRPVTNVIDSRFIFRDGLILEQRDSCDAHAWARAALGGVPGFLAGHLRFLRSAVAHRTLAAFVRKHPEYQ